MFILYTIKILDDYFNFNMKSLRITYIISIIFPVFFLVSCSSLQETTRDLEDPPAESIERTKKPQIELRLDNILAREEFKHTIPSIMILSADYGDTIYSHQSDLLVRPASNQKLFTSAAALRQLGPNYNYRTVVYRRGDIVDGKLKGDLIIKGYGDPLLSLTDLDRIIDGLSLFNIREIDGSIVVDDSFFDNVSWPSGWMWDDEPNPYVPHITALSVNDNIVTLSVERSMVDDGDIWVRVSPQSSHIQYELQNDESNDNSEPELRVFPNRRSERDSYVIKGDLQRTRLPRKFTVTVRDPSMFAGRLLFEKLEEKGITASGDVHRGYKDSTAVPLIQINTPIDSVLRAMNKDSNNLAAEMTLKILSAELYGPPGTGDGGSRAIQESLELLDLNNSLSRFVDGSGVSFYNLTTTRLIVELLYRISADESLFRPFYESLAVLGVDGTLIRRAVHSAARGRVYAKSGTLTGVSSIAGYIDTLHDERLIVAMLFQNFTNPPGRYRQIQDEIFEILLHYNREASVLTTPLSPHEH